MIKTITIIDNEDGTQKVIFRNLKEEDSVIEVKRATINFNINTIFDQYKQEGHARIIFHTECLPDSQGELYTFHNTKPDISNFSDESLLNELIKRDLLVEETSYKLVK